LSPLEEGSEVVSKRDGSLTRPRDTRASKSAEGGEEEGGMRGHGEP
jgi:hypothetical protein